MPTFRVDPIEVARAAKHIKQAAERTLPLYSQLDVVAAAASATGDGACAASFSQMIGLWAQDFHQANLHLAHLFNDLIYAQREYVEVEAAIADLPAFEVDLRSL